MSRTERGQRGPGYEYWSRRIKAMLNPGRWAKKLTHRFERRQAKNTLRKEDV